MKSMELLKAVGEIDGRWIDEYENYKPVRRRFSKFAGIAAMLALVLLVGGFGIWLKLPVGISDAQILRVTYLLIDGWIAEYQVLGKSDITNLEALTLSRGELYTERNGASYYYLLGEDNIYRLLMVDETGKEQLVHFRNFRTHLPSTLDLTKTMWYDWGFLSDEEIPLLHRDEACTFGYILKTICGVTSAEDIRSVRFEKTPVGSFSWEWNVKVRPVTLRGEEELSWIYGILSQMETLPPDAEPADSVGIRDSAYLSGEKPLALQTERTVILTLENGI